MCKIEATAILPQFELDVFERIPSSRILQTFVANLPERSSATEQEN